MFTVSAGDDLSSQADDLECASLVSAPDRAVSVGAAAAAGLAGRMRGNFVRSARR
jgi:hypothetical protein